MKWFFRSQSPGEITRDPIVGEFFSTEAIDNPAEALVREGIQNALDAKINNKIRVRILMVNGAGALTSGGSSRWLAGAWPHFNIPGNGLHEIPDMNDACSFLVFEDYGTTGLQGDIEQPFDEPGKKNPFFYFFRAEGRSDKSQGDRGRWGIGKHVFPRSSRISTYFGLTIRADDRNQFLMGHTILKSHKFSEKNYAPDGYFGEPMQDGIFMLPISDPEKLAQFRRDFHLSRDSQPGLSIVVPYVDSEISMLNLRQAVISDYFYPILKGELIVDIESLEQKHKIDADNILTETETLEGGEKDNLISLIGFANWAVFHPVEKEYDINANTLAIPAWSDDLISQDIFSIMQDDLDNGRNLAVNVQIKVREKGKDPIPSSFKVYICQDGYKNGRPIFIREGIIISDIRAPRSSGIRSMVVVEDRPLATMLGDSENPAHTQWQKGSSNFKDKYENGKEIIDFVTRIVSNIVNALAAREKQKDPNLFADIFSLPRDVLNNQLQKKVEVTQTSSGEESGTGPININSKEKYYQIIKITGGFKIIPGGKKLESPIRIKIWVAYDLRRGNPLTKYTTSDFRIESPPIKYKDLLQGIKILNVENNQISLDVTDPEFQFAVTGFDVKRDLYVKTQVEEAPND
jgi:hypothetical protein